MLLACCLEEDVKKHIWIIIFWMMWENFVQLMCFYYWIADWFCILLIAGKLTEALQITNDIWKTLVEIHIGMHFANVCIVLDQLHGLSMHPSLCSFVHPSVAMFCV